MPVVSEASSQLGATDDTVTYGGNTTLDEQANVVHAA